MENKSSKQAQKQSLRKPHVVGRFLCRIGIHRWQVGYSGSIISPVSYKCKRCKIVRVFNGCGYTYNRDANEL